MWGFSLHHGCFPALGSGQTHHLDDGGSYVCQAVGAFLDLPLGVLVVDDEGNGVQGVGSTDGGLALLGLGHLVGIAVVSGDQDGVAVLVSSLQNCLQAPAMKSKEITEKMVANMASKKFDFLRCNFPNGDMVGHTGVMDAVVYAMECVDNGLKAILEAADKYGYTVLITADHGNADQMTETKKGKTSVRTAHSLNPVPFIIYDKDNEWVIKEGAYGLANVAPTVVKMMGLTAPECWEASMV